MKGFPCATAAAREKYLVSKDIERIISEDAPDTKLGFKNRLGRLYSGLDGVFKDSL